MPEQSDTPKHAPEPWQVVHGNCIKNDSGLWIEVPAGPNTAERIVAAVNFVSDATTEELHMLTKQYGGLVGWQNAVVQMKKDTDAEVGLWASDTNEQDEQRLRELADRLG